MRRIPYQRSDHESMAMTRRLTDDETEAPRRRAELLDEVLNEELPLYAEALTRLGE